MGRGECSEGRKEDQALAEGEGNMAHVSPEKIFSIRGRSHQCSLGNGVWRKKLAQRTEEKEGHRSEGKKSRKGETSLVWRRADPTLLVEDNASANREK